MPLLGIRGDITYNPSLALCQFGYARRDGPHDMLIQGIVFDYQNGPQSYRQRFICAWGMVNKIDSKTLGGASVWAGSPVIPLPRASDDSATGVMIRT